MQCKRPASTSTPAVCYPSFVLRFSSRVFLPVTRLRSPSPSSVIRELRGNDCRRGRTVTQTAEGRRCSVVQNFHNVRAWNEANTLAIAIRRITTRFSKSEHGSLRNQMMRAAESIADNIAEGCGAATNAEFARHLDMAIKSSSELESQVERSHGYALIRAHERDRLATQVCNVRKMTWGLRKKVLPHG